MKTFTVVDPVFKTEPVFVLDCTLAQLAAYLKRRFRIVIDSKSMEALGAMYTFDGPPWRLVWVKRGSTREAPEVLHEIFHLVTRICADHNISIVAHHATGANGDETAAYLIEFFARAVLPRLRRAR